MLDAWRARELVRTWPMRGTLHLVAARDAGWLTALLAGRSLTASARRRRELGLDEEVTATARRVLLAAAEGAGASRPPLTRPGAYDVLRAAGIDPDGQRGVHLLGLLCQEGLLVQGPPEGRDPTFVLHDEWVEQPWRPSREEALATVATRYVRSHGPVSERDLAGWAGLPLRDVRAGVALAGDVLVREEVAGQELLVHVDAPPAAPSDAVALAAPFDELVLGYKERWALLTPDEERLVVPGGNGMFLATLVVGGAVRGTWGRRTAGERVRLTVSAWAPLPARTVRAVETAAGRTPPSSSARSTSPGPRPRRAADVARGARPRSPFPQQDGVDAARLTLPPGPWATVAEHLVARLGPVGAAGVDRLLAEGRVRAADGTPVDHATPYRVGGTVWVRRELEPEPQLPWPMPVLEEDERLVVVDKPPFLASTPRGRHVRETALARARRVTGRPDLAPAHRLDRLTAGVLVLVADPRHRGAYQELFARRAVTKTYLALAPVRADLVLPATVALHLEKPREELRARVVPGAPPNSETRVELVGVRDGTGLYRLTPRTGRTTSCGSTSRTSACRSSTTAVRRPRRPGPGRPRRPRPPLGLLAARLALTDPVDGRARVLTSGRTLAGWDREELLAALDRPAADAGRAAT